MKLNACFILTCLLLLSCSHSSSESSQSNIEKPQLNLKDSQTNLKAISNSRKNSELQRSLDTVVKCSHNEFTSGEHYFYYPDYGCIYSDSNTLGDIQVFLFPKNNLFIPNSASEFNSAIDDVNALTISEIKNNFDIFVRIIDKSDLVFIKDLDSPYYIKDNPKKSVYYFDGTWKLISTKEDIDQNPFKFYLNFSKSRNKGSNEANTEEVYQAEHKGDTTKALTEIYPKQPDEQYSFDVNTDSQFNTSATKSILEKEADLDMDGDNDIVSIEKPKEQDDRNFDVKVAVYRMVNGKAFLWQQNTLMFKDPVNGCMMDGLEDITMSSGEFTIVYTSCYDNQYARRHVSFSYDSQTDGFRVIKNTIVFFNPESDDTNQKFDCRDNEYLFSSYDDSCEWL